MIVHCLLLYRSSLNKQSTSWINNHLQLYEDVWEDFVNKAKKRTNYRRKKSKKSKIIVKQEPNITCIKSKNDTKVINGFPKPRKRSTVNMKTVCKKPPVVKKVACQKEGRPYRYCCFVRCNKNNHHNVTFKRITPIPSYNLSDDDTLKKKSTFELKRLERREQLNRCGLKRNDKRKNLRLCSDHPPSILSTQQFFLLKVFDSKLRMILRARESWPTYNDMV